MTPLRWIDIDLGAIAHNTRVVRKLIGPDVGFSAVVKADAYGHGAVPVARTALRSGADALAVTYLDEALELRHARIRAPLLVMGTLLPDQAAVAVRNNLSVMVDNNALLKALQRASKRSRSVGVHVKVNLGLFRWGLPSEEVASFVRQIRRSSGLKLEGIFSHPGYMIGKNKVRVEEALQNFDGVVRSLGLGDGVDVHVADSAVLLDFPEYALSRVRVGNLIYGINPTKRELPLKNPWRVSARLVHIERLTVGQAVGYGGEFVATTPMTIGTVPVGYAHGLTLEPASRWIQLSSGHTYWGMVGGVKCPFVGRVGMSHCLIDLTSVANPKVGDAVQLPLRRTAASNWPKVYKRG